MTDPYTPTTEDVAIAYCEYSASGDLPIGEAEGDHEAEFQRWLAAELATAERTGAERALREAADFAQQQYLETMQGTGEARVTTGWLHSRADALLPVSTGTETP